MSASQVAEAIRGKRPNSAGWIRTNCPFCLERVGKEDSKRAFAVHREGVYKCWRCSAVGKIPTSELQDLLISPIQEPEFQTPIGEPEGFWLLGEGPGKTAMATQEARAYLHQRGVTTEQIYKYQIGACISGLFRERVVVPVKDENGKWQWFVARAWTKKHEKPYMYPKGPKGGMFFNSRALSEETSEPLIVVESVFDAIHVGNSAVAVMGKPNSNHMGTLATVKRPVVFILDGDAWEEAMCLSLQLRLWGCKSGFVKLEPCQDPDEVDREWLLHKAKESISGDNHGYDQA